MSSVRPPSRPQGHGGQWLVALIVLIPLLAFGMWLTFNAILVKWYGLDALKATPPIYKVFMPREWFKPSPRSDPTDSLHPDT
jgi:hypothetical protein